MTTDDLTTLVIIHFSKRKIKLWKNERHKRLINNIWRFIKGLGFPVGSPDTMGWMATNGQTVGCEVKNIGDVLSSKQENFLDLMIIDNCQAYVAWAMADESIKIVNWKCGSIEVINEK